MDAWQIVIIVMIVWLLTGAAVGIAVECSPKLRREVIRQSRLQRDRAVEDEMRRRQCTRTRAERRFPLNSDRYHLNAAQAAFILSGPLALIAVRALRRRMKNSAG